MITLTQMEYFLEVAQCKSLSMAAEHLFMTQPALGRQMTAMEKELNMQLFIRSYRGIKLTPAGMILEERFREILDLYRESVKLAESKSYGYVGKLTLGLLDGLNLDTILFYTLDRFKAEYPNVEVVIQSKSFGDISAGLQSGQLDAGISLNINFLEESAIQTYDIKMYQPAFAVPVNHPLAEKESVSYEDFRNYPLMIVRAADSFYGNEFVKGQFRTYGGFVPQLHFADNMQDVLLWVESGQECALLNMSMKLIDNPMIKMYPFDDPYPNYIQLGCLKTNHNPMISVALSFLREASDQ
ncbi:MAG: LysR family transcriptional regulator [Clostridiales bacterium]|nr:LysR family transcriptional regulator [Clostridiales bacterium]